LSVVALMTVPGVDGRTALSTTYRDAPLIGAVRGFHPSWLEHTLRYTLAVIGPLVLLQAVNGTMLGLSRLSYSLATNRQIPSLLGRLHSTRSTPYIAVVVAGAIATGLAYTAHVQFRA